MTEIIGWVSSVLAIAGVVLNNRMNRACFFVWLVSNAMSGGIHWYAGMWYYVARDAVFFGLAIDGLIRWKKKDLHGSS